MLCSQKGTGGHHNVHTSLNVSTETQLDSMVLLCFDRNTNALQNMAVLNYVLLIQGRDHLQT